MSKAQPRRYGPRQFVPGRIRNKVGRLIIDVPIEHFQTAFTGFSRVAEEFAMTLSDPWERKFAYQYLGYLQEIAHGSEPSKTRTLSGRPACRLISFEMERLFKRHFFKPAEQTGAASEGIRAA
jgi:hypothetical protein